MPLIKKKHSGTGMKYEIPHETGKKKKKNTPSFVGHVLTYSTERIIFFFLEIYIDLLLIFSLYSTPSILSSTSM